MTARKGCIRIPRDATLGDELVLRNGQRKQVKKYHKDVGVFEVFPYQSPQVFWSPNGKSITHYTFPEFDVVRFERFERVKAGKPYKDDRDARWLLRQHYDNTCFTDYGLRRLRAIAKRLNGGRSVRGGQP